MLPLRFLHMSTRMTQTKIPEITVFFWAMKILATTLGETGGDLLAQTLKVGYVASSVIFVADPPPGTFARITMVAPIPFKCRSTLPRKSGP